MCLVPQSSSTLYNPMEGSPPGSSVLGDSSDKNTRGVAKPSSRESHQLRDKIQVSHIAGGSFTTWPPGKPKNTGEGDGNPLQYSCLENPVGGGAW